MNKKQVTAPAECLKMNIELADNGIIIRNPENEDEVTIAMVKEEWSSNIDHTIEYEAIGRKIYKWLQDIIEERTDFIIYGFDLDIKAVAKGREFY